MSLPLLKDIRPPFLEACGKLITENVLICPNSKLHKDQQQALLNIVDWFSCIEKKGLTSVVVMPTGTGKTGVICCLPYIFGWAVKEDQKIVHDLTKPILVLAPGLTILRQLEQNLCYNPNNTQPFLMKQNLLSRKDHEYIYSTLVVDNTEAIRNLYTTENKNQVVISNVQKWRKKKDVPNYEDLDADLFSAIVVDEAHHLPAEQWIRIIKKFESAKVIFFTATPYRSDGQEITSDRAISKTKDFTFDLKRRDAIKKKLIRDLDFNDDIECTEDSDVELEVLKAIKRKLTEKNEKTPLPGGVGHSAIVITKDIEAAESVKSTCVEKLGWANVKVVHSGNPKLLKRKTKETTNGGAGSSVALSEEKKKNRELKDRKKLIEEIHSKNYELLIVVAMLLEGFDHPPLSVAGILTNIQSQVKFAQFVGRIQRLVRTPEEETGVTGHIITAKKFNQKSLYDRYINPTVAEQLEIDDEE